MTEYDTIEEVEVEEAAALAASPGQYADWPGGIALARYPAGLSPKDMTNAQWAKWAYDNWTPKWAIQKGLLQRTPPSIEAIEPTTAAIGDPSFTLYISGTNFHSESVIVFAGQRENTTLGEDGRLSTGVNMAYWHGADVLPVLVDNGTAASAPVNFTFTAAAPAAVADEAGADPDDLDEEIEEAKADGDYKVSAKKKKK
jgi:hypothetical protein